MLPSPSLRRFLGFSGAFPSRSGLWWVVKQTFLIVSLSNRTSPQFSPCLATLFNLSRRLVCVSAVSTWNARGSKRHRANSLSPTAKRDTITRVRTRRETGSFFLHRRQHLSQSLSGERAKTVFDVCARIQSLVHQCLLLFPGPQQSKTDATARRRRDIKGA